MARPKKPTIDPAYLDADGIRLPEVQLWRWRALMAELAQYELRGELARKDYEALIARTPALVALRDVIAGAAAARTTAARAYQALQTEMAQACGGIDLSKCSIDDESGRITVLD